MIDNSENSSVISSFVLDIITDLESVESFGYESEVVVFETMGTTT